VTPLGKKTRKKCPKPWIDCYKACAVLLAFLGVFCLPPVPPCLGAFCLFCALLALLALLAVLAGLVFLVFAF
jgi:hypothetical protein